MKMMSDSIRGEYEEHGVHGYYEQFGATYRNPHEKIIGEVLRAAVAKWKPDLRRVLDLACGSGEVTLALQKLGCTAIDGIDPYTGEAYQKRTGKTADPYTFEQIAAGMLADRQNEKYSLIVCSFAMHLVEESRLPMLVYQLMVIAESLLILTPHKRPMLKPEWGWGEPEEIILDRVRARFYRLPND